MSTVKESCCEHTYCRYFFLNLRSLAQKLAETFHFCNHGNIYQRRSSPIFPVGQIIRQVGLSFKFLLEVSSINIELDIAFSAKKRFGLISIDC